MRSVILYFLLIICTACQSPLTNDQYDYGDEFELAIGEEARIGTEKISVEFVDVLEDSRCPGNVTCVWAGNGKIQLRFAQETIRLNTYLDPKDSTISNLKIQLLDLKPYPEHPVQIVKEDYRVRLLITEQ